MSGRMAEKVSDSFARDTEARNMKILQGDAARIRQYREVAERADAARAEEKQNYETYKQERITAEIKQLQIERMKPAREFKPKGLGNDQSNNLTQMAKKNVDRKHKAELERIGREERRQKKQIVEPVRRAKAELSRPRNQFNSKQQQDKPQMAFKRAAGPIRTRTR